MSILVEVDFRWKYQDRADIEDVGGYGADEKKAMAYA